MLTSERNARGCAVSNNKPTYYQQHATLAALQLAYAILACIDDRNRPKICASWSYANADITLLDIEDCIDNLMETAQ